MNDYQPGPADAGPSDIRRSPDAGQVAEEDDQVYSAWHPPTPKVRLPMSSQITLVNPTQRLVDEATSGSEVEVVEQEPVDVAGDDEHTVLIGPPGRQRAVPSHVLDDDDAQVEDILATPVQEVQADAASPQPQERPKPRTRQRTYARKTATTDVSTQARKAAHSKGLAPRAGGAARKPATAPAFTGRVTRSRARSVEQTDTHATTAKKGKQKFTEPVLEEDGLEVIEEADEEHAPVTLEGADDNADGDAEDEDDQAVLDALDAPDDVISEVSRRSGDTNAYVESRVFSGIIAIPSSRSSAQSGVSSSRLSGARSVDRGSTASALPLPSQTPVANTSRKTYARVVPLAQKALAPVNEFPVTGTRAHAQRRAQEEKQRAAAFVPSPRAQAFVQRSRQSKRPGKA